MGAYIIRRLLSTIPTVIFISFVIFLILAVVLGLAASGVVFFYLNQQSAANVTARLMPGAFGQPEDIAQMSVFLASDAAKNIYGQEIVIDGGYTIG